MSLFTDFDERAEAEASAHEDAVLDELERQPRYCSYCHGNGFNCPECSGWDDSDIVDEDE